MSKKEYIIVGDYKQHKECLIYICGSAYERAERVLETTKVLPEYKDYTNIRIKEVETRDAWWNDNCD